MHAGICYGKELVHGDLDLLFGQKARGNPSHLVKVADKEENFPRRKYLLQAWSG